MLEVETVRPDARLIPFIASYVQREANVENAKLVEPVVARLESMLEFLFADPYFIPAFRGGSPSLCPAITIVGPITERRVQLVMRGHIESVVILFRPLGLFRLFRTPVPQFAENGTEAHSVFGPSVSTLHQKLGDASSLLRRKQLLDEFFLQRLINNPALDPRAQALQQLVSSGVPLSVSDVARNAGISTRQLERLAMCCTGVAPKLLNRIAHDSRFPSFFRCYSGTNYRPDCPGTPDQPMLILSPDLECASLLGPPHRIFAYPPTRILLSPQSQM